MRLWSEVRLRLRALFRRGAMDRELDEEVRHHVEMETEAGVRSGLTPAEARRVALVKFGGVDRHKEAARDERGVRWLEELVRDVRFAFRSLRKSPGFAVAAVLTLALGVGANTAIYSVVDGVLLRPVPFPAADALYMIWETDRNSGTTHEPASLPDYLDYRDRAEAFADIGALMHVQRTLTAASTAPARVEGLVVTPSLLSLLRVRPLAGRLFTERDTEERAALVILSEGFWRDRFGADAGVVGSVIRLDEQPYTVVGVLPSEAEFGFQQLLSRADYAGISGGGRHAIEVWVHQVLDPARLSRSTHPIFMVGRLANGVAPGAARSELEQIAGDLEATYGVNTGRGVSPEQLTEVVFAPVRPALMLLLGAVVLVLLVACANVANLLLARGTARAREVAIRGALGAGGGRLARQFLVESVVLTLVAMAAGLGMAYGGLRVLLSLAPPELPRLDAVHLDVRVLGATLGVAALVALVFALVPALQARRVDVRSALAESGRGTAGGRRSRRLRSALVVAEMALAVMLVSGAGLLVKSFRAVSQRDPGFEAAHVLRTDFSLPGTRYPQDYAVWPDWPAQNGFQAGVLAALRADPRVEAAAITRSNPMDRGFTNSWLVVGREAEAADWPEIPVRIVSPGYLETVGLPLVAGRAFCDGDDAQAPRVGMLNQAAIDRFFPDGQAIGQVVRMWGTNWRVVGIVGNELFQGLSEAAAPALYVPTFQAPPNSGSILVRADGDPLALAGAVRNAVQDHDPELPVFNVEPLTATVAGTLAKRRFTTLLLAIFGAVALALMAVGVHGVLSYAVAQQLPEIGIRMALGAGRRRILRMVVTRGLGLAAAGIAIGLAGATAVSGLLASLLYQVGTRDAATLATVVAIVLAAALAATIIPARRATAADPMQTLRAE